MICIGSQCFCCRSQLCVLIVTLVRWATVSSASVLQAKRHIWRRKSHPFFAKSELDKKQIGVFKFGVLVLMLTGPFTIYMMCKCKERLIVTNRANSHILDASHRPLIRKGYWNWIRRLSLHYSLRLGCNTLLGNGHRCLSVHVSCKFTRSAPVFISLMDLYFFSWVVFLHIGGFCFMKAWYSFGNLSSSCTSSIDLQYAFQRSRTAHLVTHIVIYLLAVMAQPIGDRNNERFGSRLIEQINRGNWMCASFWLDFDKPMDVVVICDTYWALLWGRLCSSRWWCRNKLPPLALLNAHLGISVEFQGKNGFNRCEIL